MIADVAGFIACDDAADRVPLPGGLVPATDLSAGQAHHLGVTLDPDDFTLAA
ncbi:hypothetical protein [Streptomyces sp. NPDC007991]|uniref:hypothetical protein n=1 Tax=Streptomyces sp. NPDC007991 TaxID=3364803 RepID=UPI0036F0697D